MRKRKIPIKPIRLGYNKKKRKIPISPVKAGYNKKGLASRDAIPKNARERRERGRLVFELGNTIWREVLPGLNTFEILEKRPPGLK